MNTCAKCGARMSGGEAFCPQCGAALTAAAKPPSGWWRVITGLIGYLLVGFGLVLMAIGAFLFFGELLMIISQRGCAAGDEGCGLAAGIGLFAGIVGVGMTLVGAPFLLASILPFGKFWRVRVGIGIAVAWLIGIALMLANLSPVLAFVVLAWVALGGTTALFYLVHAQR
ncbi:MAG: zinc-ribbon domain-containing protein [Dehalococcoidia bacterium]